MAKYTQANRPLSIDTPLGKDALLLEKVTGTEGISEMFHFRLDLLAEAPVAFDKLLGQKATVTLLQANGAPRTIHGIISRFAQGGRVVGAQGKETFIRCQADLVPPLWLLTRRVHSRVFQHVSALDIIKSVLHGDWQLDVSFQLRYAQTYPERDRCVQYNESDFDFVSRLMEDEGIYYYFEAGKMVVADSITVHPDLPAPSSIIFEEVIGGERPEDRILTWEKAQEIRACKYTVWDHCFEMPGLHLEAEEIIAAKATAGKQTHTLNHQRKVNAIDMLEIFEYPGEYALRFDGVNKEGANQPEQLQKIFKDNERVVKLRMEQEAVQAMRIRGASNCRHLAAGHKFSLTRHFDADGGYLLTRVEHRASMEGAYTSTSEPPFFYENNFECIPMDLTYRPLRKTARPKVEGTQTATVVGPSGEEIHCDKYGRVKVQFPWDRKDYQKSGGKHVLHDSSCWVRVAQAWAGQNFGAIQIPRVGQEVIVDFLEGNPDWPIIVGCVYNAEQPPPFPLPQNRTQSGFKSHTHRSKNAQSYSGVAFEDAPGSEHLQMHSERHMTQSAEHTLFVNAAQEHHTNVGQRSTRQVGGLPSINHSMSRGNKSGGGSGSGAGIGKLHPPHAGSGRGAGSGSGGGDPTDPYFSPGPYYWNPTIMGGLGDDLDLVIGWRRCDTMGLYSTITLGQYNGTTLNPMGLVELFGLEPAIPILSTIMAPIRANMGLCAAVVGSNTLLQYGPTFSAAHGYRMDAVSSPSLARNIACRASALLYATMSIIDMLLPAWIPSQKAGTAFGVTVTDLLLGLWALLETEVSQGDQLQRTVKALQRTVAQLSIQTDQTMGAVEELSARLEITADAMANALSSQGPGNTPTAYTKTCDSPYSILAPSFYLISNPDITSTETSTIVLQALGKEEFDGSVIIHGTGASHMAGGEMAYVDVTTEEGVTGKVTIDCGVDGTLTLQSGIAQEPNHIIMSPEGITISSLEIITVECAENTIVMTPEDISLTSAESSVVITPEGITLMCGASSIEITPEGIVISGPILTISGEAETTISTAALTIAE